MTTTQRDLSRRTFMNRALLAGGAAAVAVMTGARATVAGAAPLPAPTPSASAPPPTGTTPWPTPVKYADFVGVTTDGTAVPDLFAVHSTGVSTGRVLGAARALLAGLDPQQRTATQFDLRSDQWLHWSNFHNFGHRGLALRDMNPQQRSAGHQLLAAALSARGLKTTTNIRRLNHVAGRLLGQLDAFDEDLYYFTVLGTPSAREPWGFQFQGHHLVINYFVLGDQVVMTPTFMGTEPRVGYYDDGSRIEMFTEEFAAGLAMVNSLDATQRAVAISAAPKTVSDAKVEGGRDNAVLPYAGIRATELTAAQRRRLLSLVGLFVGQLEHGHARVKMAEVREHLDDTHFLWIGATAADSAFYFRVHSPVLLVEFDCQGKGPASGSVAPAADPANATASGIAQPWTPGPPPPGAKAGRDHIHSMVRTPNGNDYGMDLLAHHLATHPHHAADR